MHEHAAAFVAAVKVHTRTDLPQFVNDEFDAFLECSILAPGFLRLQCGECGRDKPGTFKCAGAVMILLA